MELVVVGLSHRTAPVALRERIAIPEDALEAALAELKQSPLVSEVILVSTCNRVEAYVVAAGEPAECRRAVLAFFAARARTSDLAAHFYDFVGAAATRHLFRVASSLDSMVLGEPQILGQVKDAHALATRAGTVGPLLERALARAFGVAKRVRTETAIARHSASVASVAVELAEQVFGELAGKLVLVVGAGKMSALAARHLASAGAQDVLVVNRTPGRAEALAAEIGGAARPWESLPELLGVVDIVVSSTGAQTAVITKDLVKRALKARRQRSLFIIDIAVPRDVEPAVGKLDNVYLFDVDDLEKVVAEHLGARAKDAEKAELIVTEEVERFGKWRRSLGVVPTIQALRERFLGVAHGELERVLPILTQLGEREHKAIRQLVEGIANKLLHAPMTALKQDDAGDALAEAVRRLFALELAEAEAAAANLPAAPPTPALAAGPAPAPTLALDSGAAPAPAERPRLKEGKR